MNRKELKKWIEWILNDLIPDYDVQVEAAGIGTTISLTELEECEKFLNRLLEELEFEERVPIEDSYEDNV